MVIVGIRVWKFASPLATPLAEAARILELRLEPRSTPSFESLVEEVGTSEVMNSGEVLIYFPIYCWCTFFDPFLMDIFVFSWRVARLTSCLAHQVLWPLWMAQKCSETRNNIFFSDSTDLRARCFDCREKLKHCRGFGQSAPWRSGYHKEWWRM